MRARAERRKEDRSYACIPQALNANQRMDWSPCATRGRSGRWLKSGGAGRCGEMRAGSERNVVIGGFVRTG